MCGALPLSMHTSSYHCAWILCNLHCIICIRLC